MARNMCFACADTLEKPTLHTERIILSADIRLRTIPYVFAAFQAALEGGAARIELDTTRVSKMTEGALHMLAVATVRLQDRGVELVLY